MPRRRSAKSTPFAPVPASCPTDCSSAKPYRMYVISGTHWDREWRYTVEQSKLRLADLVDKLLDVLESVPDYKAFLIDGGMVVIEDYLSVRPENRARMESLMRAGRIQMVGWYTLPEESLVAPEALVRNLLVGQRIAREFGGAIRTGYTATSYGQVSQIPQIYRGFGMTTAMFYRGTNKHQAGPIFLWKGRDGARLHVIRGFDEVTRTNWFFYVHQPLVFGKAPRDLGYKWNPEDFPTHMADEHLYELDFQVLNEHWRFSRDRASLEKALGHIRRQALPYAIGRHVLALDMEDNARAFHLLPEMIRALNEVADDVEIVPATLDDYFDAVLRDVDEKKLRVIEGEIRQTGVEPGFNGLYGMTPSSRVRLKLLNERAETWLIHSAEPLASLAAMLNPAWRFPRIHLDRAWKALLQNHCHDSICGAAVDQAHEDMLARFSEVRTVSQEVTRRACETLYRRMDLTTFQPGDITLTLFNPLPQAREGVWPIVVDLPRPPRGSGYVDPCSGLSAEDDADTSSKPKAVRYDYFDILDANGKIIPHTLLSREPVTMRIERELDSAIGFEADRCRLLLHAQAPSMGYATYVLRPRGPRYLTHPEPAAVAPAIASPTGRLENQYMVAQVEPNGTVSIYSKETARRYESLHLFAESGSIGNAHLDKRPLRDVVLTSLGNSAQIRLVESNPLRGVVRVDLTLRVPAAATPDGRDRLRELVEIPITTWITLKNNARRLEFHTRIRNQARDHRIQVLFPTGMEFSEVSVESAFSVERRNCLPIPTADNSETDYPSQPMQNFVDAHDKKGGLALLSRGLREYVVFHDRQNTLGLTLLRSHRAYMTANTVMTPEEFDRYPGSHSIGEFDFEYAVYFHKGDWAAGNVAAEAYDYKVPVHVLQGVPKPPDADECGLPESAMARRAPDRPMPPPLPHSQSLLEFTPSGGVLFGALTQSEDGKAWTLRVWNPLERGVKTTLRTTLPIQAITKCRMDETQTVAKIKFAGHKAVISLAAGEIATLRLEV